MIPIPNMAHYLNTPSTPLIRPKKKKKKKKKKTPPLSLKIWGQKGNSRMASRQEEQGIKGRATSRSFTGRIYEKRQTPLRQPPST